MLVHSIMRHDRPGGVTLAEPFGVGLAQPVATVGTGDHGDTPHRVKRSTHNGFGGLRGKSMLNNDGTRILQPNSESRERHSVASTRLIGSPDTRTKDACRRNGGVCR
jgi:hypothetical protein